MSNLAQLIAETTPPPLTGIKRGPDNQCFPLYGEGDHEDWQAVDALREGRTWRQVQEHVDALKGVTAPLNLEKFKYHWRRRCACWPTDLRR